MQENQREKKKSEKKIHIRPDVHRSVQQRSDIQLSESRASLRNHAAPPSLRPLGPSQHYRREGFTGLALTGLSLCR